MQLFECMLLSIHFEKICFSRVMSCLNNLFVDFFNNYSLQCMLLNVVHLNHCSSSPQINAYIHPLYKPKWLYIDLPFKKTKQHKHSSHLTFLYPHSSTYTFSSQIHTHTHKELYSKTQFTEKSIAARI